MRRELIQTVREAGLLMKKKFRKKHTLAYKNVNEVVTEVDKQVEQFLIKRLLKMKKANIIAEESGNHQIVSDYAFVIDPIDGTTNYSNGVPIFCVSVCLTHKQKPILAAVYQPIVDDLFEAEAGKGVFLNRKKMHVKKNGTIQHAAVNMSKSIHFTGKNIPKRRTYGSTVLSFCYVATGLLDGAIRTNATPWDCAAGVLMTLEGGGRATNWNGKPWKLFDKKCVVSNRTLHNKLLKLLQSR